MTEPLVPNAALVLIEAIELCETATASSYSLDDAVGRAASDGSGNYASRHYSASLDDALCLLPPRTDWRRLTHRSMSVFAASPYNAAAQTRYDGYGPTPALQLCAAIFKMRLAAFKLPASAIEAATAAETPQDGSVHESATRQGDAQ